MITSIEGKEIMFDRETANSILRSFGLVFGYIGIGPIYTLTIIFFFMKPTAGNVIGILSLIIWTLIIVITVEYAWLAMSLGRKGEGGSIFLRDMLIPMLKSGRQIGFVTLLSFVGVSLLFGDGVITPAIGILSAVEGLILIPGFGGTGKDTLVLISGVIAAALFTFQRKGAERAAGAFGPLMFLWFMWLAVSGLISIIQFPSIIRAMNPYYGLEFLSGNGLIGFFVFSQVILCAIGGEALFADRGHLGRLPIVRAWYFVFGALLLNYLGQGAFVIQNPETRSVLFEMIFHQAQVLYVPFLMLSIIATIIASQAMISAVFSIVYQGISARVLPMLKVEHTSSERRSQIYIGTANWLLFFSVLFIMVEFGESRLLAAAYGFALNGEMVLTGIMMAWIFYLRKKKFKFALALLVTFVTTVFLLASLYKIPHGGYWSIIMALIPFGTIMIYTSGQKRLSRALKPMDPDVFIKKYNELYKNAIKIEGTALFFARDVRKIPPYVAKTMFENNIIYEDNVIVSIVRLDTPFGVSSSFKNNPAQGLRSFEIKLGYMEIADVERILKASGIDEKTIFYGIEDIVTENIIWKIYSIINRLTPAFVQFYRLPSHKIHGVLTRIEI